MTDTLKGKKILVVDDEPDVWDTLGELLDMCVIDCAPDFETAERLLKENSYDAAILDIMGIKGYDLLELAKGRDLAALVLTTHALSADHLLKSIKKGAYSYIPKVKMVDIANYLDDVIQAKLKDDRKPQNWFRELILSLDKEFGFDWRTKHKKTLKDINLSHTREKLEKTLERNNQFA